ncbi:MAG: FG-GAP-like repeat-containing protein [Casimicrobiaceae bacterium]
MTPCLARSLRRRAAALGFALAAASAPAPAYDWLQFNGNAAHSGNNTREKAIDRNNVATLAQRFQATLPATADGAPVILRAVTTPSGVRDLLFVTTRAGHLVALDGRTGATVWTKQYGPGNCRINNGSATCYTTSSPAIDPNRRFVYGYGLDGYVHKYQVADGVESLTGGWPQLTTLKGFDEKASAALAFVVSQGRTYLYVVHGGYPGDNGDYQGHVTAIDLGNGTQKVFNTSCSDQPLHFAHIPATPNCATPRSAIWARPSVIHHAALDRIYMSTGNGSYTGNAGGVHWSESIIALAPDGTGAGGKPLDAYTPTNFASLDAADADLGSTAPAILPVPPGSTVQHLALQGGKDAKLRLVNLQNLSGQGGPGNVGGEIQSINVAQGGGVLSQPAVWVDPADGATWAFVTTNSGISGVKLSIGSAGAPSIATQWSKAQGGGSPLVANGILYYAGSNALRALDPLTGAQLWSSNAIGSIHWESPVVANGMLYVSDESAHLTAFAPAILPTDADFDFSGTADLLWRDAGNGSTQLWLMNGSTLTSTRTLLGDPNWSVVDVGDFNADAKADLVWRNAATGATALWLMNGTAFVSGHTLLTDPDWRVTQVADFNDDGNSDLVWRNGVTGATAMWLMNGAALASGRVLLSDPNWTLTHTGDFDGDGRADLLWRNAATGATAIWLMNGTTYASGAVILVDPDWAVTQVVDLDGDGRSDLVWRNVATGQTALWLMNGTSYAGGAIVMTNPAWSVTKTSDLDGDGRGDLVWRNATTGETAVWLMNGLAFGSGAVVSNVAAMTVTHVGDFNGDGKADLIWRNATTGATSMWLMNGAAPLSTATINAGAALTVVNPR